MPPTIRHSSPEERREIYNTHFAARVAAGEYQEVPNYAHHPARGGWAWCTTHETVYYFDKATGERIIVGSRHIRDGKCLTKNGLDPKLILYEGVIYSEGGE
jgi:hypothetical protein